MTGARPFRAGAVVGTAPHASRGFGASRWLAIVAFVASVAVMLDAAPAARAADAPAGKAPAAQAQPAPPQRTFATPEEAVSALIAALKAQDRNAVLAVLGADARNALYSGDLVADRAAIARFVAMYQEKHAIESPADGRATLTLGNDAWPFAFLIQKGKAGWRFDTAAGNAEVIARRVGQNELAAINVMLAIVDAQREYASADRDKSGLRTYARKFASTPGRQDGLYWKTLEGEPESPLGPLVTRAAGQGYQHGSAPRPYHGYFFRMLTAQGPGASGGALDYVVHGRMIGGFAAIAYPALYRRSGVMTLIVNHDGVVYQKDLGPDTAKIAAAIARFDPSDGWTPVKAP